jgi:hypothetical protein
MARALQIGRFHRASGRLGNNMLDIIQEAVLDRRYVELASRCCAVEQSHRTCKFFIRCAMRLLRAAPSQRQIQY